MKLLRLLLGLFTLHLCTLAFAESDHEDVLTPNPHLTMRQVLQQVVKLQPEQALIHAQSFMVKAKQAMADSWLPQAPSVSLYHQNDTLGSGRNERDWQAELELPIWLPKQKATRGMIADQAQTTYTSQQASVEMLAAGLLRDALWDIALNRNEVSLFQEKMQTAQALEDDVAKAVKGGEMAKTDLMLVQQETLNAQRNLVRATAELMHAHFRYMQLTGLHEMPTQFDETQSKLDSFESSPLWLAAQEKVKLASSERDLSMVERRDNPQLILNARNAQGAFDHDYNQSLGLRIKIPLQAEVRSAPLLAASEQVLGEALSYQASLKRELANSMHEAEHNLFVSQQELDIAAKQNAIAQDSAKLALKAFKLGEIDLFQLLRAQTQAFEAERIYSRRQLTEKWDIAKYNQAVGVLP